MTSEAFEPKPGAEDQAGRSVAHRIPDLFLSYNSRDREEVRALFTRLEREGIQCWFDERDLERGSPWVSEIEEAIEKAPAVAVCIGSHQLGPVQDVERQIGIAVALASPGKRIIPIFLPTAPPRARLPGFLKVRSWVDLRAPDSQGEFRALVNAVLRRTEAPPLASGECPYRGLLPFLEAHADNFFGRDEEILRCLRRLRESEYFYLLLGASGSGKSSLVFAGLIPRIKRGELDGTGAWTVISIKPGAQPCHELALPLAKALGKGARELDGLRSDLRVSEKILFDSLELAFEKDTKVILIVDQFEELFTMTTSAEERDAFVRNLVHAVDRSAGRFQLIVTLRSDFLTKAIECDGTLARCIRGHLDVTVSQLSEEQIHEIIVRPAYRAGISLETGLPEILVAEMKGEPGCLPLLQFVLEELWHARTGNTMTWGAYHRIGGIRGALARRADDLLRQLGGGEDDKLFRQIICRLVNIGVDSADTRQRVPIVDLHALAPARARWIVDKLIESRLVTANESTIEIAHEALILHWPQLRRWVTQDREALGSRQRLAEAAAEWCKHQRDQDLLFRGQRLRIIEESIEKYGGEESIVWGALNQLENEFLTQCKNLRNAAAAAQERNLRFSDSHRLNLLEKSAHTDLWPPFPGSLAKYNRWIASAEALAAALDEHEASLKELRLLGKPGPNNEWSFDNAEDQWQHDTLLGLTTNLRLFLDPRRGTLAQVRRRFELASEGWEQREETVNKAWTTLAEVAGFRLPPELVGCLQFLGKNPLTEHWEFAHLQSGILPVIRDDGRVGTGATEGIVFVLIPGGTFFIGAQAISSDGPNFDPAAAANESPVHPVSLSPFLVSKYEVTRAQWSRMADTDMPMPATSRTGKDADTAAREPMTNISWREAHRTLQRVGLALPTEAQWEYAARGGTNHPWWTGPEKTSLIGAANLASQTNKTNGGPSNWDYESWETGFSRTAPVGSFRPNAFGLYDILGNVWEWCGESLQAYTAPARAGDGRRGDLDGDMVSRGGGFYDTASGLRCAFRSSRGPDYRDHDVGIRPVINLIITPAV